MDLFGQLNQEQKDAVNFVNGPLLVLAGAGSGKTRVVTCRIANLLRQHVPAHKILGLTFTNKAAGEMKERIQALTNSHVLICTFHSLGVRMLRESIYALGYTRDFTIYDEDDADRLLRTCLQEMGIKDKAVEPKAFKHLISKAKNNMQGPSEVDRTSVTNKVEEYFPSVYALYQSKLQQYNALDFDDLLYLTVKLLREHKSILEHYQNRWNFLLIDEYQDTNEAQYELVKLLVAKSHNLFVVGDPDQSIYSWRGANIRNIMNFERDYPGAKVIRLEQNYRSRSNILEAANAVIQYNSNRYEKSLWSDLGPGELIKHYLADGDKAEAEFVAEKIRYHHEKQNIPYSQMVVFYRTNSQSRAFEDRFFLKRIPYIIVGGLSFYQRREVKDILAFLKVLQASTDYVSFARTINLPKRGIGEASLDKLRYAADAEKYSILSYVDALVENRFLHHVVKLGSKQIEGLKDYLQIIKSLKRGLQEKSIAQLVQDTISLTRYEEVLKEEPDSYEDRKANLDALVAKAMEWEASVEAPSLSYFLEELSLKSSLDEADQSKDRVNLMTIHNGKGLEFDITFLVGMEEDLFPHANSRNSSNALEEERRLCYVGMTRAKEQLYLTYSSHRFTWGGIRAQRPSRFLREIPFEYLEKASLFDPEPKRERTPYVKQKTQWAKVSFAQPESTFIEEPSKNPINNDPFSEGTVVFHKDFGPGIIRKAYEGSLGTTYKIHFSNDNRERSLVAKFANLKKL